MTAKDKYINHYEHLKDCINNLIEDCERWRTVAEKSTPSISDMPKTHGDNQREDAICELVDCERKIDYLMDELCDLRLRVADYIKLTGDRDERLLKIITVG